MKKVLLFVVVFVVLGVIWSFIFGTNPPLDLQKEKENQLISISYDSERAIKENLKDPASYELIDRDYKFLSDNIYEVNITYSANNIFGGRIQNKYLKMGVLKFNPKDTTFINTVTFEK